MISLILSSNRLTCAQWTRIKDSYLVSDIISLPLLYDLSDVFDTQSDVNSLLNTAIGQISEKISIEGQEFIIVLPESLIIRDSITIDETLLESDLEDYIRWQAESRFGALAENWEHILQPHPWNKNNYLIHWLPGDFKSLVRLSLEEKGARPIWLGTDHMVLQSNDPSTRQITAIYDNNGYRIVFPGPEHYFLGGIFYSGKEDALIPRSTGGGNLPSLFASLEQLESYDFYVPGTMSESRRKHWGTKNIVELDLKEGISFEGAEPDLSGIDPVDLQTLAGTMVYDNFHEYVNFLGDEIIEIPVVEEEQLAVETEVDPEWEEKRVKAHQVAKTDSKKQTKKKNNYSGLFASLILVVMLAIFFTPAGSFFGINPDLENEDEPAWGRYLGPSEAMQTTSESLLTAIVLDSLHLFNLTEVSGRIAWSGDASISRLSQSSTENWIREEFYDSTAAMSVHAGAFELIILDNDFLVEKVSSPQDFIEILQESVPDVQIAEMTMVKLKNTSYLPVLIEVTSVNALLQVFDVMKEAGENIILRKIELVTDGIPAKNKQIRLYLSIFI